MKILLYSANFAPEPTGIGKYSGEMAAWLVASGHEVRVVCAPPYYPQWAVTEGYGWPPYRAERWQGVQVFRCPLWVPHQPGGLARVLHLLSFALSSAPVALYQATWRPDVVMTIAPSLLCAPAAWLTARLCGAKSWLHFQDFEIDVAFSLGLLKGQRIRRAVKLAESWLVRRFDRVSTISRRMREQLDLKGIARERQRIVPNWVDIDAPRLPEGPSPLRQELGLPAHAVVALFSGTLSNKQGLLMIPAAAAQLQARQDIAFVICGQGMMADELRVAGRGLSNFHMLPLQPAERVAELLHMADLHLLTQNAQAEDLVLPSKLSGMLASGRPVVATCHPGTDIADLVAPCGRIGPPDDLAAFVANITELADDPTLRKVLGAQARRYAVANMGQVKVLSDLQRELQALAGTVDGAPHAAPPDA